MPVQKLIEKAQLSDSIQGRFRPVSDDELRRATGEGGQQLQQQQDASSPSSTVQNDRLASFQDTSERFLVAQRVYTQQYSLMYYTRLTELKPRLKQKAVDTWPGTPVVDGIKDLQVEHESIILGVLYKSMKLKPAVLNQYMKDLSIEAPHESFLSDSDTLYLEDETVRIALLPSITKPMSPNKFVTGLVVACRGRRILSGEFEVVDLVLPGLSSVERPLKLEKNKRMEKDPLYCGFIAGLRLGCPGNHLGVILKGLTAYLLGNTGSPIAQNIIRLIVIGDTFVSPDKTLGTSTSYNTTPLKSLTSLPLRALDEADAFFASIAPSLPIDLLPGPNDFTNGSLPQQPLHKALFPQCRKIKTFRSVTNPYSFEIEGVRFLGMGPQSVEDILAFSDLDKPIEALQLIAEAQCLCPTAPDTLPCYPFIDQDPFCVPYGPDQAPHVIFSGGHASFECRRWKDHQWQAQQETLSLSDQAPLSDPCLFTAPIVITVPKFFGFRQLVLVDLTSLTCRLEEF